jgi:hypothetical protein
MEKIKPLFDEIYCHEPLQKVDEEEEKAHQAEIERLQKIVTEIERKEMIQRNINQLLYTKMYPGFGRMPDY